MRFLLTFSSGMWRVFYQKNCAGWTYLIRTDNRPHKNHSSGWSNSALMICVISRGGSTSALPLNKRRHLITTGKLLNRPLWNLALKHVDRNLSCLAVRPPTRGLIGVAMAEGICVEWVSNSSVSDEVAHTASPPLRAAAAAAGFKRILGIWACIIAA